ncbi:MAG: hypothetical protein FWE91_03065 [Defluviitaleaceae bacterium]|nr:hypothetical protein [Defluviitaleaceae bacterium]MCL2835915.1 hypothetical protein [Defluviitaleaceae bacterium]
MKGNWKKIAAGFMAFALMFGALAFRPVTAEASDVTLNMSIMFNQDVQMRYMALEGNGRPQSEYHAADGNTYRPGDFKPVWATLQDRLNFTINDVTPPGVSHARAVFELWQAENFAGVDILNSPAVLINTAGVVNGTFIALNDYYDRLPYLNEFLFENDIIRKAITAGDGNIYFAPYFDGYDDIELMIMARTDWIEKLLDSDGPFDTDRVVEPHYVPYMPEVLNTTVVAVTADGSGLQEIVKAWDKNVITAQNELPVMDGASLVQVLRDHIDAVYGDAYENRSALFIGQDAAYDADELVALMRCVLANTTFLTGQSEHDAVPLFPRGHQMGRVRDLIKFTSIWGVRGPESRASDLGMVYVDRDGVLQTGRLDVEMMDAVERLNQLYNEGLILRDFDKSEATEGLPGSDHRASLLNSNLGFMTFDYNQTTTVFNTLEATIEGFTFTPLLPPVADWYQDGTYFMYTESWRSVKADGWGILSHVADDPAKLDAALRLFDYQWSPEGSRLMGYGPEAWIDGEIEYFGRMVPRLSEAALEELWGLAAGNYTNYYRMWLGGTMPIGYIKEQGMEYQCVHEKGKIGLHYILRAVELGAMGHLVLSSEDAKDPSYLTVPTHFAFNAVEERFLNDFTADFDLAFRDGNNNADRIIFVDYILYGFGGTTPAGDVLLDKEGLREFLIVDMNGELWLEVYREAYDRMMN